MIINRKVLDLFSIDNFNNGRKERIEIRNSVIKFLDLRFEEFYNEVSIENCVITTLGLHTSWFAEGFKLTNCVVEEQVQFEMGGHNHKPIQIVGNVFKNIFCFLDCWFMDELVVKNNVFLSDCTLWNTTNTFDASVIDSNNIGDMHNMRWD